MIQPPRPGDAYPGRLPTVREQWRRMPPAARVGSIAAPALVVVIVALVNVKAGATLAVLAAGAWAASAMYVKNRTDRHNAAVDAGEITVAADPHFRVGDPDDLPRAVLARTGEFERGRADMGRVLRFDHGWIVGRTNPRDVAVVIGDDGGWARFDPRTVTDLWAAVEYQAGRGRDG